jgi:hypothetical protein
MANILEVTLPYSGRTATIRRPTGRDMVEAEVLAGEKAGRLTVQLALLSRLTMFDGKLLPYEDFLQFDGEDISFLLEQDMPKKESPPAPLSESQD